MKESKEVKDGELPDKEEIAIAKEDAGEQHGDVANVQATISLCFFFTRFLSKYLCNFDNDFSFDNAFCPLLTKFSLLYVLVILTGMCYIYFILFFVLIVGFSWNYLC